MSNDLEQRRQPWDVVITEVDSTPRDLSSITDERSRKHLERVRNDLHREMVRELHEAFHDNRRGALNTAADGSYFTRCACGWTGLRVADPEVARREYDVHVCRMTGVIGERLHRTGEPLTADWIAETKRQLAERGEQQREAVEQQRDEFEARVQMLELK